MAAQELSDNARPGAAAAAVLPLLQPSQQLSCMRAHARAAAAALVLTLDEQLIEELCRCAAHARRARVIRSRCVSLVAQSGEPLFFEFIVEAGNPFTSLSFPLVVRRALNPLTPADPGHVAFGCRVCHSQHDRCFAPPPCN